MSSTTDAVRTEQTRTNVIAALLIVLAAAFWLWFSSTHELVQDEAYYWQWSRHLAVGYYDNTPMMAWVIALMTHIFGNTEIGVRSGAILCSCVSAWFLYKLATQLLGPKVGLLSICIVLVIPLFSAGGFLMTADPPQMAFWSLTAYTAWNAITSDTQSPRSWGLWLLSGAFAGLAAMSKVNGLFVLPSVLLFLAIEPSQRKWLTKPQPYIAAVLALAIFSPFVWWNHEHSNAFWLHINRMSSRADSGLTLKYFGDYIGSQAALISPLLFLTYLWALYTTLPSPVSSMEKRYCWALSIFVFVFMGLVSLKSRVEGNWAVTAYVTGVILVAKVMADAWATRVSLRVWHGLSYALALTMTVALYAWTFTSAPPRISSIDQRMNELFGWKQLASGVEAEKLAMGDDPFIFGVNYKIPSELAFYLPGQPQTYCLMLHNKGNQYEFWTNASKLVGRNAILVMDTSDFDPEAIDDARIVFRKVEAEPNLEVARPGFPKPIRTLKIYRCYGFKGYRREDYQTTF